MLDLPRQFAPHVEGGQFAELPLPEIAARCSGWAVFVAVPMIWEREVSPCARVWRAQCGNVLGDLLRSGVMAVQPHFMAESVAADHSDAVAADCVQVALAASALAACRAVIVPPVVGWRRSLAVYDAVQYAAANGRPVYFMQGAG